ncbi:MAG: 4-(cytidine 5'-diphospho)-2-C-methyl-D-erythritol kinase [Bacteroidota bacterium]|nr:4-(cytidine 5'-diphospho)-2-C-methyl-D-erythritol kinase [Bacteroidota bacterium]
MVKINAYTKINLGLRVLRKREDGYHDIETVFHRVNPYDEISLEPSSSISFTCNNPILPTDERNLCVRAAKLLQEYTGIKDGVKIFLKKNIPIGAGLGGGSSDAASTLLGLVKLWNIDVTHDELHKIALQLGSDVPYFLKRGTAHATGRGEILEYFDLDIPYWIILVYPNIHISTAWAYQAIHDARLTKHTNIQHQTSDIPLKQLLLENINAPQHFNHLLHNDFEPIVLHSNKTIAYLKLSLYSFGAKFAQMSGSGSAVYGFFSDEQEMKIAVEKLDKKYLTFVTPPNLEPI